MWQIIGGWIGGEVEVEQRVAFLGQVGQDVTPGFAGAAGEDDAHFEGREKGENGRG